MDFSTEYDASDKSSMDDSDEACTIPGSFSPDNNQDGASGDQRYDGKQKSRNKKNNEIERKGWLLDSNRDVA